MVSIQLPLFPLGDPQAETSRAVIISFEKSASDSDRDAAVKELEGKGATIVKDQNKHSKSAFVFSLRL